MAGLARRAISNSGIIAGQHQTASDEGLRPYFIDAEFAMRFLHTFAAWSVPVFLSFCARIFVALQTVTRQNVTRQKHGVRRAYPGTGGNGRKLAVTACETKGFAAGAIPWVISGKAQGTARDIVRPPKFCPTAPNDTRTKSALKPNEIRVYMDIGTSLPACDQRLTLHRCSDFTDQCKVTRNQLVK